MAEWKLTEADIEKILNTPLIELPLTKEHENDLKVAREILRKREEKRE